MSTTNEVIDSNLPDLEIVITVDTSRFQAAMAEANASMERILRPLLIKISELSPLIAELHRQERAARSRELWTAYHARRRTRSRK